MGRDPSNTEDMPMRSIFGLATIVTVASLVGCSSNPGASEEPLAEGMGAVVANVPVVPSDVRCIEVNTSDYRVYNVRTDVTPGQEAHLRLAPLQPGYMYLSGTAYSRPCADIYASDGGSAATWQADYIYVTIQAGTTTNANLVFRKLADLNVDVQFQDPCVCSDGGCHTVPQSGGEPQDCSAPGPSYDGGVPRAVDAASSD
jgi:hypothetical protein